MGEYRNFVKGLGVFSGCCILILGLLYMAAMDMSAGTEGFQLSGFLLLLQALVMGICYSLWYIRVDRKASDLMNLQKMRKVARKEMKIFLIPSIAITGVIMGITVAASALRFFFIGIPAIYICGSAILMFITGNALVVILMLFFGQPNRITGDY